MEAIQKMVEARKADRAGDHTGAQKLADEARRLLNLAVDAAEADAQDSQHLADEQGGLDLSHAATVQSYVNASWLGLFTPPAPAPAKAA